MKTEQKKTNQKKPGYSITQQLVAYFAHPAITLYLTVLSVLNYFKSLTKPDKTHWENQYAGQPILVLALFQRGKLRPDLVRMLEAAKTYGFYVVATNTLRLSEPNAYNDVIDTYTETHNFGRDFGSYKQAFGRIFNRKWHLTCPRMIMMNDSIFYSFERMPAFFEEMMESDVEVLGSTENYEINYHLGSFCIAMCGSIARHPKFIRYWQRYRRTDVRPRVIKRGEMGLSKALKKCVSDPSQMRALYDSLRFTDLANDLSEDGLNKIIRLSRRSALTPAKRFFLANQLNEIEDEILHDLDRDREISLEGGANQNMYKSHVQLTSFTQLKHAIAAKIVTTNNDNDISIRETIVAALIENFRCHSQIHQNAAVLVSMGLPIVKLDGVYRGVFNILDVGLIVEMLDADERKELERLLFSRPFGGEVLVGWQRSAFVRGLI